MREHADGTRIRLIEMTDPYPVPVGTEGTITGYEPSIGYLNEAYHVKWDNGSTLKVLVDVAGRSSMVVKLNLVGDLRQSLELSGAEGYINNRFWRLHWRFGIKRIEEKARDNVLSIASIDLDERLCGRGHFTALIRHLVEHPDFAGRSLDWIYVEQCRFRLGEHLRRELGFTIEDGMVIDAWRRTTSQMELGL